MENIVYEKILLFVHFKSHLLMTYYMNDSSFDSHGPDKMLLYISYL